MAGLALLTNTILLLPILGCIFVPYTLLAYCLAIAQNGSVSGVVGA